MSDPVGINLVIMIHWQYYRPQPNLLKGRGCDGGGRWMNMASLKSGIKNVDLFMAPGRVTM